MNSRLLLAALGLSVLSNAVLLAGVWYNRQGEPESRLLLSERELLRNSGGLHRENSGLSVRLNWRMPLHKAGDDHCNDERSLTPAQLQALGLPAHGPEPRQDTRPAWAILELDGPLYRQSLQQAEDRLRQASAKLQELPDDRQRQEQEKAARQALVNERNKASRLFLADVGPDPAALRQRYPDRSRHALLRGTVRVWTRCHNATHGSLSGTFTPDNPSINVPHAWRRMLAARLPAYYGATGQPFSVEISTGQRLQPWISAVSAADNDHDESLVPQ